jgi:hypothetical protein
MSSNGRLGVHEVLTVQPHRIVITSANQPEELQYCCVPLPSLPVHALRSLQVFVIADTALCYACGVTRRVTPVIRQRMTPAVLSI